MYVPDLEGGEEVGGGGCGASQECCSKVVPIQYLGCQ
jgi:hypothetical protein